MSAARADGFPLFPLPLVALPSEHVPLHIFEPRFRTMIEACLDQKREFGVIWLADDELKPVGCACAVERVLERHDDGTLDILARGTRPFRLIARASELPFPAGSVEFVLDGDEIPDADIVASALDGYLTLLDAATDSEGDREQVALMSAYEMAATVEFGLDAKQRLLELRSENARLALLTRLLRAALKRLEYVDRARARARSNGKVRFG
jgi:Lon protease-like protein